MNIRRGGKRAKLIWRRYRSKIANRKSHAKFMLEGKCMFSGFAPDGEFNRALCRAFNGVKP